MQWTESGCRSGTGAGGGRSGVETVFPRIVGNPGEGAAADATPSELGRGGLAQNDGARRLQAGGHRAIGVAGRSGPASGTLFEGVPLELVEILDGDWHAVERPEGRAVHDMPLGLLCRVEDQVPGYGKRKR